MGLKDWLGRLFLGPSAVPPPTSQNETVRTAPPSVVDAAVLVLAPTVTATTQPVQAQSGQIPRRHWAPTGFFPVCAVGESFYQEAIQSIAVNEGYVGALVYCMATLVPYGENPHDPLAVAVWIDGKMVAHLSREEARTFRSSLEDSGIAGQPTTCDAVIFGAGVYRDHKYDYSVELDFRLGTQFKVWECFAPTYPLLKRVSPEPVLTGTGSDGYALRIPYVRQFALFQCMVGHRVDYWTEPARDNILINARGALGTSGFLASLSKDKYPFLEQALVEGHLTLTAIEGRACVVKINTTSSEEPDDPLRSATSASWSDTQLEPAIYGIGRPKLTIDALMAAYGEKRREPHTALTDCESLVDLLLRHTGKTTRSHTYACGPARYPSVPLY